MITATVGGEPTRIDLDVLAGEPVDTTVTVLDADGDVQNVSAWTLTATAYANGATLHTFTVTGGAGGATVTADDTVTATWSAWGVPSARWDLWATPPAGDASLLVRGWVRVR